MPLLGYWTMYWRREASSAVAASPGSVLAMVVEVVRKFKSWNGYSATVGTTAEMYILVLGFDLWKWQCWPGRREVLSFGRMVAARTGSSSLS